MADSQRLDLLFDLVRQIPPGRVCSYGMLGEVAGLTARQVGSFMKLSGEDDPWWRVLAADGRLAIEKSSPRGAIEQRRLLEAEGVIFKGERVPREPYFWQP